MENKKFQTVIWDNIPTNELILAYVDTFNCVSSYKRALTVWSEFHSKSCRNYIKDEFLQIYAIEELNKNKYLCEYVKNLHYVTLNFKGEEIDIPIDENDADYNWSYWTTFELSDGTKYDVEIWSAYNDDKNSIILSGKVYCDIYECDGDEIIDNFEVKIK